MMPVMQFRRTDQYPETPNGQTNIGVNINCPKPTKGQQPRQCFEWKSHDEGGQVDQTHRVNRIERVLPMRGQPIQVFGAVMDRMETPQEADPMLKPMPPIN